jgi:hypothetical protein
MDLVPTAAAAPMRGAFVLFIGGAVIIFVAAWIIGAIAMWRSARATQA